MNGTDADANGFTAVAPSLDAGQDVTIGYSQFIREDGLRFDPKTYAFIDAEFYSDQGHYSQLGCDAEFTKRYIERQTGHTN